MLLAISSLTGLQILQSRHSQRCPGQQPHERQHAHFAVLALVATQMCLCMCITRILLAFKNIRGTAKPHNVKWSCAAPNCTVVPIGDPYHE